MGDEKEEYRKAIREFIARAQKIHLLLIAFSLVVFVFGFVEIREIQERKAFVKADADRYHALINYAQSVATGLRETLLLEYSQIAPSEESRSFALIYDIEKARDVIRKVRRRVHDTAVERQDVLPAQDETKVSLSQLTPAFNTVEGPLYFRKLALAEVAIGTIAWSGGLQDRSIDDLARLGHAASAKPGRIIERLSRHVSEKFLDPTELEQMASILGELADDAGGEAASARRSEAERLWTEWLKYRDSSFLRTAEVETANINNLVKLYTETQADLDNLTSWEKGEKGVVLPGIPGEMPLALSIWCAPLAGSIAFALGIVLVIRATQVVETARSKKIFLELDNSQVPYVLALRGRGGLLGRALLHSAQFVALFFPLSVMISTGVQNPALWPVQGSERLVYWAGVLLTLVLTLLFAMECAKFRKASENA